MRLLYTVTRPGGVIHEPAIPGDVGYDLEAVEEVTLLPGEVVDIPLGVAVELPVGRWAELTHRSSAPRKLGVHVLKGTIDNGYRGELFALTQNLTTKPVTISPGTRIAQLILYSIEVPTLALVEHLSESARGRRGFGSTGLNGTRPVFAAEAEAV